MLNLEAEKLKILDNYLISADLKDYTLTLKEEQVLKDIKNNKISFGSFTYKNIFNNIKQGRRLTKDDQKSGNIPFVMAGVTNTGVVNYISNPVATFPKNSITVDIFGNTFYRNYDYGAGDDTGAYWNSKVEYSKELMLFFTTAMEKSIFGKFDYGNKLRSSQSFDFEMQLPIFNKKPDFETMETFISAILKLVIKDVVIYVNKKLE
ncbi:restriction endonuclease subunit S [Flavobacterium psychrophilum]|uniref:restriction endonuclease subunit S n=1 Tax=Flavobacterium psychrophilum TaxID=96345 RepID=UPI002151BF00|nr:restriction endonuclease subunit S [Flavobacterium psychrophilum]